ncbi:hypothetical protein ARMSODRAFT_978512 [Armillaria solidipes]|uniref:Uncharacterized protein n=1 Tax=Armillaria solidipes TaxID=1076256 RepID=A0A2H3BPU9_9AGAR|nr:hypothetical protein ARMSODRAFT_978512 [Armillaria solidipes]
MATEADWRSWINSFEDYWYRFTPTNEELRYTFYASNRLQGNGGAHLSVVIFWEMAVTPFLCIPENGGSTEMDWENDPISESLRRSMSLNFSPTPTAQAEKLKSDVSAYPDLLPARRPVSSGNLDGKPFPLVLSTQTDMGDGKAIFAMLIKTRYATLLDMHTVRWCKEQDVVTT